MAVGWRSESPSSTGDFLWFSSRCYLAHTVLSHSLFSPELRMYKRGRGSGHLFITYPSFLLFAAAAKSLQSCPTLCNPTDGSPPGSPSWDSPGKSMCMKVKSESEVTQSCPTLSDPMDCSLPGSSIHGIFQARVLEWGAIAFSILLLRCIERTEELTKVSYD